MSIRKKDRRQDGAHRIGRGTKEEQIRYMGGEKKIIKKNQRSLKEGSHKRGLDRPTGACRNHLGVFRKNSTISGIAMRGKRGGMKKEDNLRGAKDRLVRGGRP